MQSMTMEIKEEMLVDNFLEAARSGDLLGVEKGIKSGLAKTARTPDLRERNMFLSSIAPEDERTALMLAVVAGQVECARALLPVSDPLAVDFDGANALFLAALKGQASMVKLLATPEAASMRGPMEMTAFMAAAARGNVACLQELLAWSDPLAVDENGWDALMWAAISRQESDAEHDPALELLAKCCNLSARNKSGLLAADLAAQARNPKRGIFLAEYEARKTRDELLADGAILAGARASRKKPL